MFEWFGMVSYCPHTKVADFARHLKDGRLMGSKCTACGHTSFPPRADCAACRDGGFEFTEWSGRGSVVTFTRIAAAPAGFEDQVPFTVGVVDLEEGGRLLAWFGASIPVVMAVQGAALGAGFELALMADILLASDEAVLGQPEIRLGFFAPVGVVVLPQLVGRARALEITALGRNYSAAEMAAMGIVSRVTPAAELDDALAAVLKDLRRASPLVLHLNTRTLKRVSGADFAARLDLAERVFLEELMTSEDPSEGIEAFYGKRRPEWRNR